jgi:predicted metal-dependent phosphoesterase TrpH
VLGRKGYVRVPGEAFRAYLGCKGKAYLPKTVLEPEDGVGLLSRVGATVSLAHPLLWKAPEGWLGKMLGRLKDCGLDAIEAYHREHSQEDVRTCLALAKRFNLGVSGGSDYHGANKPAISLGKGYGGLFVGWNVLQDLLARRRAAGLPCPQEAA